MNMFEIEFDVVSCLEGCVSDKVKIMCNVFYFFFIEEI